MYYNDILDQPCFYFIDDDDASTCRSYPVLEVEQNTVYQMAVACPPQTLTESFAAELDDSISMYDPNSEMKIEQVHAMDFSEIVESLGQNIADKTFLDLTVTGFEFDELKQGDMSFAEEKDLKSWVQKHPEHWSTIEVLDWIYYIAGEHQLDVSALRGENFNTVTGPELCIMSLQEFKQKDPTYGAFYYNLLQQTLNRSKFLPPANMEQTALEHSLQYPQGVFSAPQNIPQIVDEAYEQTNKMLDNNIENLLEFQNGVPKVNIAGKWYDFDEDMDLLPMCDNLDPGYQSGDSDSTSDFGCTENNCLPSISPEINVFSEDDDSCLPMTTSFSKQKPKPNRRQNTESLSSDPGFEDDHKPTTGGSNRGRKPGQSSKGNHLWEFIRDLLKDPQLNPSLLRWEDKENGVFRFVQSEAVAQMWGKKKNNPGMTYEKLSRAMRFCRSAGYFDSVPKTGKYPKKLCFRFGPKAFGWTAM